MSTFAFKMQNGDVIKEQVGSIRHLSLGHLEVNFGDLNSLATEILQQQQQQQQQQDGIPVSP